MSSSPTPAPAPLAPPPSDRAIFLNALAFVGVIGLFALIVAIAYVNNQPPPVDQARIEERLTFKQEVLSAQSANTKYAMVDENAGKVRLSQARAIEVALAEMVAQPNASIFPAGDPQPVPQAVLLRAQGTQPTP